MSEHEYFSAGAESRRATPGNAWSPEEPHRQEALLRYLGAVAAISTARAVEQPPAAPTTEATPVEPEAEAVGPEAETEPDTVPGEPEAPRIVRVRDVMDVPAVSVRGDLPFLDLARTLARENIGAVPVVDAGDRVIGVVSESDLLAKAAVESAEQRPGPIGRLREHRLREKAKGETAATLMTAPAITVRPGATVADAARIAARSKLKRMPVTDWHGRLVGVVHRAALLSALVRDDDMIRKEIETRIITRELHLPKGDVEVTVRNGVVDLTGRMDSTWIPRLLEAVGEISDVTEVRDHLVAA